MMATTPRRNRELFIIPYREKFECGHTQAILLISIQRNRSRFFRISNHVVNDNSSGGGGSGLIKHGTGPVAQQMAIGDLVVVATFTDGYPIIIAIVASTSAKPGPAEEMVDHHAGDIITNMDGRHFIVDTLATLHHDIFRRGVYRQAVFFAKINLQADKLNAVNQTRPTYIYTTFAMAAGPALRERTSTYRAAMRGDMNPGGRGIKKGVDGID